MKLALAVMICFGSAAPPADPWIPVTRVEAPRPESRKLGYYKHRETGTVSYFDGCNWCSLIEGTSAMTCTSLYCAPPEATFVVPGEVLSLSKESK